MNISDRTQCCPNHLDLNGIAVYLIFFWKLSILFILLNLVRNLWSSTFGILKLRIRYNDIGLLQILSGPSLVRRSKSKRTQITELVSHPVNSTELGDRLRSKDANIMIPWARDILDINVLLTLFRLQILCVFVLLNAVFIFRNMFFWKKNINFSFGWFLKVYIRLICFDTLCEALSQRGTESEKFIYES